jgi:hypothetical protein
MMRESIIAVENITSSQSAFGLKYVEGRDYAAIGMKIAMNNIGLDFLAMENNA